MKVAILLATYNSGKYLREQLDSLFQQNFLDWVLFIHDDGSTDDTLSIVGEYKKKYSNIEIIGREVEHLGPKKNFMFLLENVEADYYLFCDHDDIWFKTKVEITINAIQNEENGCQKIPVIFHSDLTVVDAEKKIMAESMWKYAKIFPKVMHKRNFVLTSCYITGCTLAINNAAKNLLPSMPENAIMHDWWIGVNAVFQNMSIISYDKPTMFYRLHGANDSGIPNVTPQKYLKRILNSFFISNYDRQVKPFVKMYNVKYYHFFKALLVMKKIFN